MDSLFFDIALPRLQPLASLGASVATELACKCDIVVIRKDSKRIEVVYEPYGLPFCDVKSGDEYLKRIDVDIDFTSASRMGRGDKSTEALSALQNDLRSYIDALYPMLEDELR